MRKTATEAQKENIDRNIGEEEEIKRLERSQNEETEQQMSLNVFYFYRFKMVVKRFKIVVKCFWQVTGVKVKQNCIMIINKVMKLNNLIFDEKGVGMFPVVRK